MPDRFGVSSAILKTFSLLPGNARLTADEQHLASRCNSCNACCGRGSPPGVSVAFFREAGRVARAPRCGLPSDRQRRRGLGDRSILGDLGTAAYRFDALAKPVSMALLLSHIEVLLASAA